MRMILMGTGTSHGVPVIGCDCAVCTSGDPRDKRLRCSAYIQSPARVVIDTGPEFRIQALRHGITGLDAVLITHSHADHLNGLDDLRIFSHTKAVDPAHPCTAETEGAGLPVYANATTIRDIRNRFDYIFMPVKEGGGKPKLNLVDVAPYSAQNPMAIGALRVVPVSLLHGTLADTGYVLCEGDDAKTHGIAYLTDCNGVPEQTVRDIRLCAGTLEHLVIDGLREKPHSTHFSFAQALDVAERLGARHTWLTHMTHNMGHEDINRWICGALPRYPNLSSIVRSGGTVQAAYDGLVLDTTGAFR